MGKIFITLGLPQLPIQDYDECLSRLFDITPEELEEKRRKGSSALYNIITQRALLILESMNLDNSEFTILNLRQDSLLGKSFFFAPSFQMRFPNFSYQTSPER
jgi:hypothetical protein